MKINSCPRETKTYTTDPYVTVELGVFRIRVDKEGVSVLRHRSPSDLYTPLRDYESSFKTIPVELFKTAIEEWEKIK